MSDNSGRRGEIKPIGAYLPKFIKFYDIKDDRLAPGVFVIILAVSFLSNILPMSFLNEITVPAYPLSSKDVSELMKTLAVVYSINLGTYVLINLFSSVYLYAYIRDLRGVKYTLSECWSMLGRRFVSIIVLSIINVLMIFVGMFVFVIPGVVMYLMFIFSNCYMLDKGKNINGALRASLDATNGHKKYIFGVITFFYVLMILIPMLVDSSGGPLIYAFISAFLSSVINLMYQRLIAMMYLDIEYPAQI